MRKRRKRGSIIRVPVASMGDIAFLLIIFFMVCSRFAQENIDVEPPVSLDAMELEDVPIVITIDATGTIYFQGRELPDGKAVERAVRRMLEGKTSERARTVLFRCDRSVKRPVYEAVIDGVVNAGGILAAVGEAKQTERSP